MRIIIIIITASFILLSVGCKNLTDEVPNNMILDYYTCYQYNDQGKVVSEKAYSHTDSLMSIKTSTYKDGRQTTEADWQPGVGIIGFYVYSYDPHGNKKSQSVYDKNGRLLSKWEYFYDSNNKITTNIRYDRKNKIQAKFENCLDTLNGINYVTHFDTSGVPTSFDSTIWTSKNASKQISFKNNKSTLEYIDTFDDKKRLIERTKYDNSGNIVDKIKWENFVADDAKNTTFYNSDNEITTFALDKYDDRGQKVKTEWYKHLEK